MNKDIKDFERRCKKIVSRIIGSYPKLKNSVIMIEVKKLDKSSMFAKQVRKGEYKILISYDKYKDSSDEVITGGLAHELSHFEDFETYSILDWIIGHILFRISKSYRRRIEARMDIETIKKGYGKELLANRKERTRKNVKVVKFNQGVYMTPEELKREIDKVAQKG